MEEKRISLLGSTGSIGTQTLDVARRLKDSDSPVRMTALAAGKNIDLLERQAREFRPEAVCVYEEKAALEFRQRVKDMNLTVLTGMEGLCQLAAWENADLTLNAVVGMVGLRPTLAAVRAKKTLALANKETLVAGGALVMAAAEENGVQVLPVDSEHSAIFQCLQGRPPKEHDPAGAALKKLILTASGGPFFGRTAEELKNVTPRQALKHPNWSMGAKVTIDSSTLMNKGLEVIEASWLFHMPPEKIDVVIHRESIVHSLIEFSDNSVLAQLGLPDMRIPIQYALTWPGRSPSPVGELDLAKLGSLSFFPPDRETFPCLDICVDALRRGGLATAAANGANEAAVELFLAGKIAYPEIPQLVAAAVAHQPDAPADTLEAVLEADREARAFVTALI